MLDIRKLPAMGVKEENDSWQMDSECEGPGVERTLVRSGNPRRASMAGFQDVRRGKKSDDNL